ncbi:RecF/RecN/SMC N terminal domain protein [Theileria parva strain Muguga]|uniref:Structural maintenance of chromosomes protein n=1 Tax=Theileria parva TaxID=5875 RepID=Q4N2E0_THEPA|nr:RecF/RecN/SMC N terminal domain protein [Theileria parva strain Muguga]EAN31761.1 RecF/RecN/SMC N terminal domain protein [Theileria parva strain Muguga]|eukprot:XP_764044.1 condensin subunit [Theileria parva strain Muguga]
MFIEYVILDGFKSYSTRTVIGPLDPHFNAVTGLNGSGKSNVLDSLCFVFGISDLSTVRANKLDELIYKQGQAGITRATVTIIINNTVPMPTLMHPYRNMKEITITRQIALGGKNKYFINNHPATAKNIFDFYDTASMNVNNARFLIMQGRVTKVVNMKPRELLDLIEEASGTRVYENKKTVALRLIKRKDEKMEEIRRIITDDIAPMMEKLKSDKEDFQRYNTVKVEFDKYKLIYLRLQHKHFSELVNTLRDKFNTKQREFTAKLSSKREAETLVHSLNQKLEVLESELAQLNSRCTRENNELDQLNKELSKLKSNRKISEKESRELLKYIKDLELEIADYTAKLSEFSAVDKLKEFAEQVEQDKRKLSELQKLANSGGKVGQITQLTSKISATQAELTNTNRVITHLETEISKLETKLQEFATSRTEFDTEIQNLKSKKLEINSKIKALELKISEFGSGDPITHLNSQINQLNEKKNELQHQISIHQQLINRFTVHIRTGGNTPDRVGNTPDSDPRYFGQVYEILKLSERGLEYSIPIHVLIGYKFSYLVAQDSQAAKSIFKFNNLSQSNKKITIIPLNDIKINHLLTQHDLESIKLFLSHDIHAQSTSEVNRGVLGYWEVFEYDERFLRLVQYVGGNCVFCSNDADARKIAYSKELKRRFPTATLQGDKYDISGTMSGGGNKYLTELLKSVTLLEQLHTQLSHTDQQISTVRNSVTECRGMLDELYDLKSKQELCTSDLLSLELRLKNNEYYNTLTKLNNSKEELTIKRSRVGELTGLLTQLREELESLSVRAGGVDLESKIKILKESIKKSSVQLERLREQNMDQQLKKSTLEHQLTSNQTELDMKKSQLDTLNQIIQGQDEEIESKKREIDQLTHQLTDGNKEVIEVQNSINSATKEKDQLLSTVDEINLSIKQLEYDLETVEKDINEANVRVIKLQREHSFLTESDPNDIQFTRRSSISVSHRDTELNTELPSELNSGLNSELNSGLNGELPSGNTGSSDSLDTLDNPDLLYVKAKLEKLTRLKEKLSRRINQKAQQMYDDLLYEYNDLMRKLSKVQNDRDKIEKTITELDIKKKKSVDEMFERVNLHFAEIFSLLLSNATCKLVASDGKDISSGIVMKICFNNVWKNSLAELSGGQRSLLALALILSMLKVKPAPIYILDEIDAALDLSHTQNIGKMVKQQFQYSQFIIISLKEGMFTNANILFKVKFINGKSTVTRHSNLDNTQKSTEQDQDNNKRKRI